MTDRIFCDNCGTQITSEPSSGDPEHRNPCPRCGSFARRSNPFANTRELSAVLSGIGHMKTSLDLGLRGWINMLGLFVQIKGLPRQGSVLLQAGGKYRSYFVAECYDVFADRRSWEIKVFDQPTWDRRFNHLVGPTFEIACFITFQLRKNGSFTQQDVAILKQSERHFKKTGEWQSSPVSIQVHSNDKPLTQKSTSAGNSDEESSPDELGSIGAQDQNNEAIEELREVVKTNPEYIEAHVGLGAAYSAQGNIDKAIVAYREALSINPAYAVAHLGLGTAYSAQGNIDKAIEEVRQALVISPEYVDAHQYLGICYQNQGKIDEAIAEYKEALCIHPGSAEAHFGLGTAYTTKVKIDEAIEEFGEALKIRPDYAEAHVGLGAAYLAKGKTDEAIEEFGEALKIKPDSGVARISLGTAYSAQGNIDKAIEEFGKALKLDPEDAIAHIGLGAAYGLQGRVEEAMAEYRRGLIIDSDGTKTHFTTWGWSMSLKMGSPRETEENVG